MKKILIVTTVLTLLVSCKSISQTNMRYGHLPRELYEVLDMHWELKPAHYTPVSVNPYILVEDVKDKDSGPNPLKAESFALFLKQNEDEDRRTYFSIIDSIQSFYKKKVFADLLLKAKEVKQQKAPFFPSDKGKLIDNANPGWQKYEYPGYEGATLTLYRNGLYEVTFADGSTFRKAGKDDFLYDQPKQNKRWVYVASQNKYTVEDSGCSFEFRSDGYSISSKQGSIEVKTGKEYYTKAIEADTGHILTIRGKNESEYILTANKGVRLEYFPQSKSASVVLHNTYIQYSVNNDKIVARFNEKSEVASIISKRYFEGIVISDLDKTISPVSRVKLRFPGEFVETKAGVFRFLHSKKDEGVIKLLELSEIKKVVDFCNKATGMSSQQETVVVLPADLEQYSRIHRTMSGTQFGNYPLGYSHKDIIVMWPPSVARYGTYEGQNLYLTAEIYETLAHEYIHNLISREAGFVYPVPHWLHEGLALYVETQISHLERSYWIQFYNVMRKIDCFMEWDLIALRNTSSFSDGESRMHYAQSYAFVSYLVAKFGMEKVVSYVRSFKVTPDNYYKGDLVVRYKSNFKDVFSMSWEDVVKESKIGSVAKKAE